MVGSFYQETTRFTTAGPPAPLYPSAQRQSAPPQHPPTASTSSQKQATPQYDVINVEGEIHNSAGPGHLDILYDLLSEGLITTDKFCEMYSSLMRTDRDTISEINAIVDKSGRGKEFSAKSIYNSTAVRR
ncbi:hypothetical protein BDQ17DRAFT_1547202 [Cyathus striatus]|nr:hypothetical protein BDQ17DRAFT_1547202 [Cyathus striatus]